MAKRSGGPIGRLSVQLVASHVLVAVVSLASAGALVALLAPRIFEVLGNAHVPGSAGAGRGTGGGLGVQMAEAVRQSLGWGLLVGVSAAVVLGVIAARWLRPAPGSWPSWWTIWGRWPVAWPTPSSVAPGCWARWATRCAPR